MAACSNPLSRPPAEMVTDDAPADPPGFASAEGLRCLLVRLAQHDPGWRTDPQAAALMRWCADRYAALARKYHQEPYDAATAAFEAMRHTSTQTAEDPWAVVTVAVRITLIAQDRADGLLTATGRARRAEYSVFHDAERFSDRATPVTDDHPALKTTDPTPGRSQPYRQLPVVTQTRQVLTRLGWPAEPTWTMVEHLCVRLADIGDRHRTYEILRRDKTIRARFDVTHDVWISLLRLCLGHHHTTGRLRQGLLACLLLGEDIDQLVADPTVAAVAGGVGDVMRVGERVG